MSSYKHLLAAIPAAALLFGTATAQTATTNSQTTQGAMTGSSSSSALGAMDKKFINDAAQSGMAEVKLGELASQNGNSSEVKEYGNHMVADHTKANEELMALAKAKGITPPQDVDNAHQKVMQKMTGLKGAAFDKAFMAQMVTDHRKSVALFKTAASTAKDPEIKAFASKTLPSLQAHLTEAQTASKSAGKTAQAN